MGHIKDIKSNLDPQAFPGATFEIQGTVPEPQCSEAKIEGDDATTENLGFKQLRHTAKFTGWNLTGKVCTITTNPGGNTGDFDIDSNTNDFLFFDQNPGNGSPTTYYVHNGGELILTRDIQSFAEFIHAAGYAYTIKGGKLFTSMPSALLKNACSILFDPLT